MVDQRFRANFPACASSTYLNVAARAPMSNTVKDKLEGFIASAQANGGDKPAWLKEIAELRSRVAGLIGARATDIAFTKSTTDGLGAVAAAFPFEPGDNAIVCPELEHANNVYLWWNLRSRGVEVRAVPAEGVNLSVDVVRAAIDDRTRIVSVTALSFVTGARPDLAALSALCKEHDIMLVVDGVQAVGAMRMDVGDLGIDAMAAATQKMLLGLYGAGMLYVSEEWLDRLAAPVLSVQGVELGDHIESDPAMTDYKLHDSARRFEVGNPNFAGLLAFSASLSVIEEADPDEVHRHITELTSSLMDDLDQADIQVITPREPGRFGGIISFRLPDGTSSNLFEEEGIVLSIRRGLVRSSFHLFNNADDVAHLVKTVRRARAT